MAAFADARALADAIADADSDALAEDTPTLADNLAIRSFVGPRRGTGRGTSGREFPVQTELLASSAVLFVQVGML